MKASKSMPKRAAFWLAALVFVAISASYAIHAIAWNRCLALVPLGAFSEADPYCSRALNALEPFQLSRRVTTNAACTNLPGQVRSRAYRGLAESQGLAGRHDDAMNSYARAIDILRSENQDTLELAYTYLDRGRDLMRLGRTSESRNDLELARPLLDKFVGPNSTEIGTSHHILADGLSRERLYSSAEEEYRAADANYIATLGRDHPWRIRVLTSLALTSAQLGKSSSAKASLIKAKRIAVSRYGAQSREVAAVDRSMGMLNP